jgi:hypothetical protein
MTAESDIKSDMRLWAVETLVVNLMTIMCVTEGNPLELAERTRAQMLAGARQRTFPEADPATSDLLSAELESAVERLMGMAIEQIRLLQARRP